MFFPVVLGALAGYCLLRLWKLFWDARASFLRRIPSPEGGNLILGNSREVLASQSIPGVVRERWLKQYGPTLSYRGVFPTRHLLTTDTKAISHVLFNAYDYPKPSVARKLLGDVTGEGLLTVEGDKHKQQRKIMNPAFSHANVREFHEVFLDKAIQLRQMWTAECLKSSGKAQIDTVSWLTRLTLDVIARTGFNHKIDSLDINGTQNEVHQALVELLRVANESRLMRLLWAHIPVLKWIPSKGKARLQAIQDTLVRLGRQLLAEAKVAGDAEKGDNKDLFSLLVRANASPDVPVSQRMNDADVFSQVPTFLLAGHETTSTAVTWAIYYLCRYLDVQTKLRQELLAVPTSTPTMEELNALPYLDWVIKETMRVKPPVPSTIRVAAKDDVIPLRHPVRDTSGMLHDSIPIKKGEMIDIPIMALNRDKSLWGEDAEEYRPERWEKIPEAVQAIPGVWGNMMTFIGGPRSCIGYRFSIAEMKVILFTIIREFEVELAVPYEDIISKATAVQRPVLKSSLNDGSQMPIFVTIHHREG
ncbi:cytochrome P450 monooxygenase [Guyanagaster necrorhizus]|uniref:Cytochrome P450 monooxygenase n=1 Tax=Guyanagaster necrorhizus TaxID=856835 RepID=A0A9P7W863_9AGAR|nr:cytochrome P450 monooxygenase [Guyanagaster necrorhizus MCA 3950]KAG7453116.1 cytochrome P450 monooxygenase [Guyanagaster necrorhizus MCA 3950]